MLKIRALRLLHMKGSAHLFSSSPRRYASTVLDVTNGAWAAPKSYSKLLGNRVLVVSMGDPASEEHAKHMLSELQTLGMQGHRCTMLQAYPTTKEVALTAAHFRRTGSNSVLSIGSGAVADFGKALRVEVEGGMTRIAATVAGGKKVTPLLHVATTLSPTHALPSCGMLHPEDDVLVCKPCLAPDVRSEAPCMYRSASICIASHHLALRLCIVSLAFSA
jgi:hypothetical protein